MHHNNGHLVGCHCMSYIISNLPKVAIWRSKDFRIQPCIAEKSTTLLFSGTFGHTVEGGRKEERVSVCLSCFWNVELGAIKSEKVRHPSLPPFLPRP